MGHKRKRQEDATAADEPAPKKQATEKSSSTTAAAERRQKRSERKSKKSLEAKKNASRNGKKNKAKYEPKGKSKSKSTPQASTSPELVKASLAITDNLAQGQDFVSLTGSTSRSTAPPPSLQPTFKKAKKSSPRSQRKNARAEKAKLAAAAEKESTDTTATTATTTTTTKAAKPTADPRFIVFVGNLPFSTTTDQITSHFRKLTPTSIRHPSDKDTGKSKGYAFLEFDNYSSMKTCLKVYHHSMFDPERTSKLPEDAFDENGLEIVRPGQENRRPTGRRINVELTAGGGGKSEDRKEKIRVKNTRLEEQRDRRREAEKKEEKAKGKKNKGISGANATEVQKKEDDGRGDIHPSRLKRVKA